MSYSIHVTVKQAAIALEAGATTRRNRIYFSTDADVHTLIDNINLLKPTKKTGELRALKALLPKVKKVIMNPSDYRFCGDYERLVIEESKQEVRHHELQIKCTSGQTALLRTLDLGELARLIGKNKANLVYSDTVEEALTELFQHEYARRCIGGEKRILSTILAKMGKTPLAVEPQGWDGNFTTNQMTQIEYVSSLLDVNVTQYMPHFSSREAITRVIRTFRKLHSIGLAKESSRRISKLLEICRDQIPVDTDAFKAIIEEMKQDVAPPAEVQLDDMYGQGEDVSHEDDMYQELVTQATAAYFAPSAITDAATDMQGPSEADLLLIEQEEWDDEPTVEVPVASVMQEEDIEPIPDTISLDEYREEEEPYCDACGEELDFCECDSSSEDDDCCVMQRIVNTISYFGRDRVESWGAVWSDHDDYEVFYTVSEQALSFAEHIDEAISEIPEDDETAHERIGEELEAIRRQAY